MEELDLLQKFSEAANNEKPNTEKTNEGNDNNEESSKEVVKNDNVNINDYFKKFGDYDANTFEERYNKLSETEKKYKEEKIVYENKLKELNEALEGEKSKQALYITDPLLAKLNILKNKGVDEFDTYATLALKGKDAINPLDIIANDMKKKYPELSKQKIEKIINKQYGLDKEKPEYEEDIEDYETEMIIAKNRLKNDANSIISKYEDELNKVDLPQLKGDNESEKIIAKTKAKETWTPYLDTFVKDISKVTEKINIDNNDIDITFTPTEEDIKKYNSIMENFVYENGISFTKDTYPQVAEVLKTIIIKDNIAKIAKSAYITAIENNNREWEKKINGENIEYRQNHNRAENGIDGFDKLLSQSLINK